MNLPFAILPVNQGYIIQSLINPQCTILDSRDYKDDLTLDTIETIARNLNEWYYKRYVIDQYQRDGYED